MTVFRAGPFPGDCDLAAAGLLDADWTALPVTGQDSGPGLYRNRPYELLAIEWRLEESWPTISQRLFPAEVANAPYSISSAIQADFRPASGQRNSLNPSRCPWD